MLDLLDLLDINKIIIEIGLRLINNYIKTIYEDDDVISK